MNVGYKNDYVTSIDIAMLTPSQEKTLEAKIENAYPVSINEIEFAKPDSGTATIEEKEKIDVFSPEIEDASA